MQKVARKQARKYARKVPWNEGRQFCKKSTKKVGNGAGKKVDMNQAKSM